MCGPLSVKSQPGGRCPDEEVSSEACVFEHMLALSLVWEDPMSLLRWSLATGSVSWAWDLRFDVLASSAPSVWLQHDQTAS